MEDIIGVWRTGLASRNATKEGRLRKVTDVVLVPFLSKVLRAASVSNTLILCIFGARRLLQLGLRQTREACQDALGVHWA